MSGSEVVAYISATALIMLGVAGIFHNIQGRK